MPTQTEIAEEAMPKPDFVDADMLKIIEGCKKNDRLSQAALYKKFFGKMMAMCLRYAANRDEALEILNEGFLKVFTGLNQYHHTGSFEGWVRKIIFNTAMDTVRARLRYKEEPMAESSDASISESLTDKLQTADLMNLLLKLPEATRTVFNLFAIEGYKHQEIAELLKISEGTSKWHVAEARKLLQQMLNKLNY